MSTAQGKGTEPIRVLVVDDHPVVRSGVVNLLRDHDDIVVVAEAGTGPSAVEQAQAIRPDVVLMDVRLEGSAGGIDAAREIRARHPEVRVLMLTSFADDDALFASIMAGASGYLLKQMLCSDIAAAVRQVGRGQSLLDPAVTDAVLERVRQGRGLVRDEKLARLSPREQGVLELVAEGKTNKEISDKLYVSEKTVKNHLSRILAKLEVGRRGEAAAYFARHREDAT